MNHLPKASAYLFNLLLILLPFNLRHIFNFEKIQAIEGFREHLAWSIYGFDIVLIFLLFTYLAQAPKPAANRESEPAKSLLQTKKPFLLLILALLLSTLLSSNLPLAFYSSARFLEALIFFFLAKDLLKKQNLLRTAALIIFASGVFQSLIALGQFLLQKSLGLKYLGESLLSPGILGVAKLELHGEKFIRAYGTLAHPNLLGAFLLLSFVCGCWIFQNSKEQKLNSWHKYLFYFSIFVILAGIFLSFSRSVWLATFILLMIFIFQYKKQVLARVKFYSKPIIVFLMLFIICFLIFPFLSSRLCLNSCPNDQSYTLRKTYNLAALKIIKSHPFFGLGPGNFVPQLKTLAGFSLQPWQQQPVHNLYLLIASEVGLSGLIFFLLFIFSQLFIPKQTNLFQNPFFLLFGAYLLLGLFDHYFWTLPPGQLIFWLSLAFATKTKNA